MEDPGLNVNTVSETPTGDGVVRAALGGTERALLEKWLGPQGTRRGKREGLGSLKRKGQISLCIVHQALLVGR